MMRLLSLVLLLLFMTGCSRYTVGAINAAPRVVSGGESVQYGSVWDTAQADELAPGATPNETVVDEHATPEDTVSSAEQSGTTEHGTSIPELDNALLATREAFGHVRGSMTARREAAESLETAREALHKLSETGAISHWEELNEYFEVATEKMREGTNDAPNALNRLLTHLEEAGQH